MKVGNNKKAIVVGLELNPIGKSANIVAKMHGAGRAVASKNAGFRSSHNGL